MTKQIYEYPNNIKLLLTGDNIEDKQYTPNKIGDYPNATFTKDIIIPENTLYEDITHNIGLHINDVESGYAHDIIVGKASIPVPTDSVLFTSDTNMTITPKFNNGGYLEYSTDKINWNIIKESGEETDASKIIYIRGKMDSATLYPNIGNNSWEFNNASNLSISGNLNTLLDYEDPPTNVEQYCYYYTFAGCTSLTDISKLTLSATVLGANCYQYMFYNCLNLNKISSNLLPATTLTEYCYNSMFQNCTSLTSIPTLLLPADLLEIKCYAAMFTGCTSLLSIPSDLLPSMILSDHCYDNMFHECISLVDIPSGLLPADTLAEGCYQNMFNGCILLTEIPSDLLPAVVLENMCYHSMFRDCTSLVINEESSSGYSREFVIPANNMVAWDATNTMSYMLTNTAGTMNGTPYLNTVYYTKD